MKLIKKIGTIKFYITRSMGYLAIINTFMLLYLTLKEANIKLTYIPIMIASALILSVMFGYIEMSNMNNPMLKNILKRIDELGEKWKINKIKY